MDEQEDMSNLDDAADAPQNDDVEQGITSDPEWCPNSASDSSCTEGESQMAAESSDESSPRQKKSRKGYASGKSPTVAVRSSAAKNKSINDVGSLMTSPLKLPADISEYQPKVELCDVSMEFEGFTSDEWSDEEVPVPKVPGEAPGCEVWTQIDSTYNPLLQPCQTPHPKSTTKMPKNATPYDYFSLVFDEVFYERCAQYTNNYAVEKYPPSKPDPARPWLTSLDKWQPTTSQEIKAFIGINILMGIKQLPDYSDYFSTDPLIGDAFIASVFTKRRWEQLSSLLQVCPPVHTESTDRLASIRPLVDLVQHRFKELRTPGERLSVAEAAIRFNGTLTFRQCMKARPDRWGMKVYMLYDSQDGYCYNFHIKTRRGGVPDTEKRGQGHAIVMQLADDYLDKYRRIYFDKWFNSVSLAKALLQRDTYMCGTAHATTVPHRQLLESRRGSTWTSLTSSDQLVMVTYWRCSRDVFLISTCCPSSTEDYNIWFRKDKVTVQRPVCIAEYNKYTRGAESLNHMVTCHVVCRKSRKQWKSTFLALVNFALANARILWLESQPKNLSKSARSFKRFKLDVLGEMTSGFSARKTSPYVDREIDIVVLRHYQGVHSFVKFKGRKRVCVKCTTRTKLGAKRETVYGCDRCCANMCKECFINCHQ